MKHIVYLFLLTAFMAACNNAPEATEVTEEQEVVMDTAGIIYKADTNSSVINWEGASLAYKRNGTIGLKEGSLIVKEGLLTAGSFTIDMKSIKDLDLIDSQENAYLVDHLNDTDFFNTRVFPTGKFEITSVILLNNDTAGNTHTVSGNLTLKGQAKNITFPVKAVISESSVLVTGKVVINRLDWGIRYSSTTAFPSLKAKLKNNAIRDEIRISISVNAKRS